MNKIQKGRLISEIAIFGSHLISLCKISKKTKTTFRKKVGKTQNAIEKFILMGLIFEYNLSYNMFLKEYENIVSVSFS